MEEEDLNIIGVVLPEGDPNPDPKQIHDKFTPEEIKNLKLSGIIDDSKADN